MTKRLSVLLLAAGLALLVPTGATPQEAASQEERVTDYPHREEQEIRSGLEQILSAPEYRRLGRREKPEPDETKSGWLERLWEWLKRWLSSSSGREDWQLPAGWLEIFRWALTLLAAAVVIAVVVLIFKAAARRSPSDDGKDGKPEDRTAEPSSRPPGELAAEEYLSRALALAEAADYKAAIRQILLGTMSWIERQGLIRYRRGLSNRDYLCAVIETPRLRESLEHIVGRFEEVYFGRRLATSEGFQECLDRYRRGFQGPS